MTKIVCPHCHRAGSSSKAVPRGAKVKCPACGASFRFEEADSATFEVLPSPIATPTAMAVPAPAAPAPATWEPARTPASVVTPPAGPPPFQQVIQVAAPERERSNPVGIAALILGILAVLIAWVPFLGLLAIPAGLLGALLGTIGLVYGLVTRRGKVVATGVGLGLSLGSVVLSVAVTGMTARGIRDAVDEAKGREVAPPVLVAANDPAAPADRKVADAPPGPPAPEAPAPKPQVPPKAGPKPQEPPNAKPDENEGWVVAPQPAGDENIAIRITSVAVDRVRCKILGEEKVTDDPYLIVSVEVYNLGENRKLDYKSWGGTGFEIVSDGVSLHDNFGNRYKRGSLDAIGDIVGRTQTASIYPGKSIRDVLIFEVPIESVKHLDLVLPGGHVGIGDKDCRFRIPAKLIRR